MIIIYKTDNWHSDASKDVVAVATTLEKAIRLIKKQVQLEEEIIPQSSLKFLRDTYQTQGYEGEGEFLLEDVEVDELIE